MKILRIVFGEVSFKDTERVDELFLIHTNPVNEIKVFEIKNGFELYGIFSNIEISKTVDGRDKIYIQPGRAE